MYPKLERTGIVLHHLWVFFLYSGFGRFNFFYSAMLWTVATTSCGLFLALVFGLGHNGMATYDAETRPDFWKLQVRSDEERSDNIALYLRPA